jgi:hypothetical protein
MSDLTASEVGVPALLQTDIEKAAVLAKQKKAVATRKAYASDFAIFSGWRDSRGVPVPAGHASRGGWLSGRPSRPGSPAIDHGPPRGRNPLCAQAGRPRGPNRGRVRAGRSVAATDGRPAQRSSGKRQPPGDDLSPWRSFAMRGYSRGAEVFEDHAGTGLL